HQLIRRTVDPPVRLRLDGGAQRAVADDLLAEDVRGEGARSAGRRAGHAYANHGGRDAAAFRHRLLDVLLAARDAVDAPLPELRRASPEPALDVGCALRRRRQALRRLRATAAGLPARARAARHVPLLALEACDGDGVLGRGADAAVRHARRMA